MAYKIINGRLDWYNDVLQKENMTQIEQYKYERGKLPTLQDTINLWKPVFDQANHRKVRIKTIVLSGALVTLSALIMCGLIFWSK